MKEKWGQLTDDELDVIAGKKDVLVGKIQKKYGIEKEEAEEQLKDFERNLHWFLISLSPPLINQRGLWQYPLFAKGPFFELKLHAISAHNSLNLF